MTILYVYTLDMLIFCMLDVLEEYVHSVCSRNLTAFQIHVRLVNSEYSLLLAITDSHGHEYKLYSILTMHQQALHMSIKQVPIDVSFNVCHLCKLLKTIQKDVSLLQSLLIVSIFGVRPAE